MTAPHLTDGPPLLLPGEQADLMTSQAAAELSQELTLVATALFTQLLPGTAVYALVGLAGRSEPEGPAGPDDAATATPSTAAQPPEPAPSSEPTAPLPMPQAPLPVPVSLPEVANPPGSPDSPGAAEAPAALPVPGVPVPLGSVPVPALPVPVAPVVPVPLAPRVAPATVEVAPEPPAAGNRSEHLSLAMLEEISFLDE